MYLINKTKYTTRERNVKCAYIEYTHAYMDTNIHYMVISVSPSVSTFEKEMTVFEGKKVEKEKVKNNKKMCNAKSKNNDVKCIDYIK